MLCLGKHHDCEVCNIEDIKDEKINKLKENMKCLEQLSNSFGESINKLKEIFNKINENKEELKLKIQKIFTKIRNEINNREDELLLEIDNQFDKEFFKEEIIKESEKLYNKAKKSLENNPLLNEEYKDNSKINILINECINIENNINAIKEINENIKKYNNSNDLNIKLSLDNENEIKQFLSIKLFGKINSISNIPSYKWSKKQVKKYFKLSNNDKTIKIDYSD